MAGKTFQEMSLGEIADFRNGKAISPERYSEQGRYPVLGANGQIARSDDVLNAEAVVAIGRVGAYCGSVHYIPEPSWVTDNAIVATAKPGNDVRFLYYLLGRLELRGTAIGSAQPLMTQGGLRVLQTIVPRLKEQQAVACILGALDDKIELNRRMNGTLEAMARALFKSWFVDFDPVRAKAAGQKPRGLAPHVAKLFPDSFEKSELGEIPKGWRSATICSIASTLKDSVKPGDAPTKVWEHYSIPAFDAGREPTAETGDSIKSGKYRVPPSCVLVSKLNPQFPRVWLPNVQDEEAAICSTEFIPFVPRNQDWRSFLYELMKSHSIQRGIEKRVTGSTGSRQRAKVEDVASIPIVEPPVKVLDQFCSLARPMHDRIDETISASRTLASLRDALLPKLISGEIRVRDAERIVGRCVA